MGLLFGLIWKIGFSVVFLMMLVLFCILFAVQFQMMIECWGQRDWRGFADRLVMATFVGAMAVGVSVFWIGFIL